MTNSLQAALTKIKNEELINKTIAIQKRTDTVLLGAHVSHDIHKQLKIIAAEESKKQQDLLLEALELLFAKYGKQKI